DGYVSDRWLPVSPVTGRLDAFQWKVPVAELGERPAIEAPREVASPPLGSPAPEAAPAAIPAAAPTPPPASNPFASPAPRPARAAPIIPLAQIPDDPGPDAADEDPSTAREGSRGGQTESWQRFRQLFR